MNKSALEALRIASVALVAGLLCMPACWAQTGGTREFLRVPASAAFEPDMMPFQGSSAFSGYATVAGTPWISLQLAKRPNEKLFVHLETLRWAASGPSAAVPAQKSAMTRQDTAQEAYSAQDVRKLWTNRQVPSSWLTFDDRNDAVRQELKNSRSLPTTARIQALTGETYSEIYAASANAQRIVLKRNSGQVITPEAPAPTWAEPLFHAVFIACVAAERPIKLPLAKEVLGNRYETDKRCGLMSDEGRWLARPEFEFMEWVYGKGYPDRNFLLMLRGQEPCISTMRVPVKVTCLGQALSSLFASGKLPFSNANPQSPRRGGDAIGYVAADGGWALDPKFSEARAFSGKIATVDVAGMPEVIDGAGKSLTPPIPSDPIAAGWLDLRTSSQMSGEGLINRSGQMVIPFLFSNVSAVIKNSYKVCRRNGCRSIQVPSAALAPEVKPVATGVAEQAAKAAARWVPAGDNDQWGYQDANGLWKLKPKFEETEPFEAGLAKAKLKGKWGVILLTGEWLHRPQFELISPFFHGVAVAQEADEKHYLLHADGKLVDLPGVKQVLSEFGADGLAVAVGRDGGVGYIDRNGEWFIQPVYSQAKPFEDGYAVVRGKLPTGWRPANFAEPPYILLSTEWLSVDVIVLRALVGNEKRIGLMDKDGNWLVPAP
jgi:hypothetical protein